ncbi:unnamed protein product, partial [Brassica rapa]
MPEFSNSGKAKTDRMGNLLGQVHVLNGDEARNKKREEGIKREGGSLRRQWIKCRRGGLKPRSLFTLGAQARENLLLHPEEEEAEAMPEEGKQVVEPSSKLPKKHCFLD